MAQIDKPNLHFNTKLYTGNGSVRTETGVGFQPDLTWIKDRTGTNAHVWTDAVRGANYQIYSNLTNAQTNASGYLTAFASDGFTLGTDGAVNQNSDTYASWNWKANGAGSSNTDGDITSTVSANTTAGFSIVKYTGNGSNDQRVGHGLGARPTMWMIKRLGTTDDWIVYHQGLASNWYDDTYLYLNSNNAVMGSVNTGTGNPTTSVFYIGDSDKVGKSGDDYIAYVFAEKKGFSKFGSYTGNGNADGTFVYTGFKPAFVMVKRYDGAGLSWRFFDSKRNYNVDREFMYANLSDAETGGDNMDFLSNGFKSRNTSGHQNGSGDDYIYMAFAAEPLVGSNDVPATAE